MATHALKCWPLEFEAIRRREKVHEIRGSELDVQPHDVVRLREWMPTSKKFSGRECFLQVTYVSRGGSFGLPAEIIVFSFKYITESDRPPSGNYPAVALPDDDSKT